MQFLVFQERLTLFLSITLDVSVIDATPISRKIADKTA